MNNFLLKALAYDKQVRIYVVRCDEALNEIAERLNYYPSALAAVGRVMAFTTMMGGMLKLEETVTVKVEGDGPIGLIMAEADAHGHIRAYASNPHCHFEYNDLNKLNVKQTVGSMGYISVIKDLKLKEPFIGTIPIINGELGEDFAYYLAVSEQVPSVVSLGVLVNENNKAISAGGFIVQLLPNTKEEVIDALEKKIRNLPTMSELFSSDYTIDDIGKILGDDTYEVVDKLPVSFKCTCSKERFSSGIISLGKKEIEEMIEQDHQANTICHFCGSEYKFTEDELIKLKEQAK
ncbi:MAG: Hsp33 family molecular chaperone HslO [Bacilli bacterium]|nr:Hsp33 family molecular chaperone HslO [Bacilli bacterium]